MGTGAEVVDMLVSCHVILLEVLVSSHVILLCFDWTVQGLGDLVGTAKIGC